MAPFLSAFPLRPPLSAADLLPGRGLRPDRPRVREGRAVRRTVPERPDGGQRPARAGRGRRLHDARRHPRQRRQGRGRPRSEDRPSGCGGRSSAEGISICPETAVCFDVLERMVAGRRRANGRAHGGVQHRGRAEVPRSAAGRVARHRQGSGRLGGDCNAIARLLPSTCGPVAMNLRMPAPEPHHAALSCRDVDSPSRRDHRDDQEPGTESRKWWKHSNWDQ